MASLRPATPKRLVTCNESKLVMITWSPIQDEQVLCVSFARDSNEVACSMPSASKRLFFTSSRERERVKEHKDGMMYCFEDRSSNNARGRISGNEAYGSGVPVLLC